ncbi:hypothetical protein [Brevundimonas balnearis]|uniref:YdhG-like domain-containing protein n=1 Tax=Brevundimonas balnearis TaxID=1572858 RepID=A0ABV6R1I2_9CAUL
MSDFDGVFAALRAVMLNHAEGLTVTRDAPGDLVVRTRTLDATGEAEWFGAVTIKKSYVAFHLMPIYCDPALAADLSPDLTRRRQGKSCFNFKREEPALFAELDRLTGRAREVVD